MTSTLASHRHRCAFASAAMAVATSLWVCALPAAAQDDAAASAPREGDADDGGDGEQRDEHIEVVVPPGGDPSDPAGPADDPPAASEPEPLPGETAAPQRPRVPPAGPPPQAPADEPGGRTLYGELTGAYRFRLNYMSEIPLTPLERSGIPPRLGQTWWGEQWIRLRGEVGLRSELRLVGELDVLDGVVLGEQTEGVATARYARQDMTAFQDEGIQPRKLYLEWRSPIGLLRGGLMTSQWGMGLLANDGATMPPFGDYRYGNRVFRLAFATKPLGEDSPFVTAVAGDYVLDDLIANLYDGQRAWQGILALFYEKGDDTAGVYGVYRKQTQPVQDPVGGTKDRSQLQVYAIDLYARWHFPEPSGGRIFAALESVWILGNTTATRSVERDSFDVRQALGAAQLGHQSDHLQLVLEGGYASGDSNALDGVQRRAFMHPDHRIGLIMFPEVFAWQTARSATLAQSAELFGRPSPGSEFLPTNGGVAGAYYLFPYVIWTPLDWLDARLGAVWGRASSAVADPYRQRAHSENANYQGGDARNRDLGLELDASLRLKGELSRGVTLLGGVEGGIMLPGGAFDDADGRAMDPVGMVRLRTGLEF